MASSKTELTAARLSRLEASTSMVEAITTRLEALATSLEAIKTKSTKRKLRKGTEPHEPP